MFGSVPVWYTPFVATGLASVVAYLFQYVKAWLELISPLNPASKAYAGTTLHDQTLRALVFVLNLVGIIVVALGTHAFDPSMWYQYALLAGAQAVGGHLGYTAMTSGKMDAPVFGDTSTPTVPAPPTPDPSFVPTDDASAAALST